MEQNRSQAQIVATLGPASSGDAMIRSLIDVGVDVFRLNLSWGTFVDHAARVQTIRTAERETGKGVIIVADLPGPRIQESAGHTYDHDSISAVTDHDRECIRFAIDQKIDYVAVSFVGSAQDIEDCRAFIAEHKGNQHIIAKIERSAAVQRLQEIISRSDAVMVARGDLGNEVPLEKIPFVQADIIKAANEAGKPVITATQMMTSMVSSSVPTRAEVTDVENAIMEGSDAVMLSEETARGKFPVESVSMMERAVREAEKHIKRDFNLLVKL